MGCWFSTNGVEAEERVPIRQSIESGTVRRPPALFATTRGSLPPVTPGTPQSRRNCESISIKWPAAEDANRRGTVSFVQAVEPCTPVYQHHHSRSASLGLHTSRPPPVDVGSLGGSGGGGGGMPLSPQLPGCSEAMRPFGPVHRLKKEIYNTEVTYVEGLDRVCIVSVAVLRG